MSRSTQRVFQLVAGVHLAAITKVVVSPEDFGHPSIRVTFTESRVNKIAEVDFNINKPEFIKLCKDLDTDIDGMDEKSLLGKRVWLCVDEEVIMSGAAIIKSTMSVFKFVKCVDSTKPPKFIPSTCYSQEETNWVSADKLFVDIANVAQVLSEKEERLAEARRIIAEGEKKEMKSLNEKNKPKEEDWSL